MFTKWRAAIEDAAGSVVKSAGDGFMAVFASSAGNAVRAADALRAAMPTIDAPRPLRVRVGIAAGEASHESGDWFGTPVVEAARLCAAADPDEVLLSDTARKLVGSRGGYEFTAVGSLSLKGLAHPLPAYALGCPGTKTARPHTRVDCRRRQGCARAVGGAVVVAGTHGDDGTAASPVVPKPHGYTPRLTDRVHAGGRPGTPR
jgi:class 3 adenylate cyclase